jgi:hypothetical protein
MAIPRSDTRYFFVREKLASEQERIQMPAARMNASSFLAMENVNSLRRISWKRELTKPKIRNIIIREKGNLDL